MYKVKYILSFNNDFNELIEIFFQVLNYTGVSYPLIGATDCLTIQATTGDENKQEPLIGTEAIIKINVRVDDPVQIADLIATQDLSIRVTIYMNRIYSRSVFQGFIVVEDNFQPLLDKPYILQVRALDGIGFMKGVYFLDTMGNPFAGKMSIVGWLAQILAQTGQTLNLRVYFNIFHASFATNINPLEQTYIDAITFATGTVTPAGDTNPADFSTGFDDFFTVLQKIVTNFRCKLFQEDGVWNLVSLWEYLNPNGYSFTEYSFGDPVDGIVPFTIVSSGRNVNYDLLVGKVQIIAPVKEDANLYLKLATKSFEYTYTYDQSINKICNQDLSQGTRNLLFDEVISSNIIDPSIQPPVNLVTQGYDPFCFDHLNGTNQNPYPSNPSTTDAFIRNVIDTLGYTLERFLVMKTLPIGTATLTYLRCSRLLIDQNDILQFSITWRTRVTLADNTEYQIARILLYGDDGTFWSLFTVGDGSIPGNFPVWKQTDANFQQLSGGTPAVSTGTIIGGTTQWLGVTCNHNISALVPPAKTPVSGSVEILLCEVLLSGPDPVEYWYKEISVTILPLLQGSYQELQGDYNFSESNQLIRQTVQEDVQISDSPKRYFKGALLGGGMGEPLLTPQWAIPGAATPGLPPLMRFTQAMEYVIFSHFCRIVQKIEGSVRGFVYPDNVDLNVTHPAGMLNTYMFTDTVNPTKRYMLTSFSKDYNTCQWRAVFVETRSDQNDLGLIVPDSFIFAYLFQSQ